jgi:drug/metabolite transporter (DMT)-like permease
MSDSKNKLSYLALGASILVLGFSPMFVRWADAPGPITGFYRMAIAVILLLPFVIRSGLPGLKLGWRGWLFPILGGVANGFDMACWSTAVHHTTAANATLLNGIAPLWVALFALFVLREKLKGGFWIGLLFVLVGAVLVMGGDYLLHPTLTYGDLIALISSLFYGAYFLITQHGRKYHGAIQYMWIVSIFSGLTLLIFNLIARNPLSGYSSLTYLNFMGAAVFIQIIAFVLSAYALGHLPASLVAPTMVGQPITVALFAIPLLGEMMSIWQIVGTLLTVMGIFLVNRRQ